MVFVVRSEEGFGGGGLGVKLVSRWGEIPGSMYCQGELGVVVLYGKTSS